ncbi:methyltransferase domain-containing protein [Caldichromatium japonicum]|uniref:Methyltransferase domain-containing protein n=1 Tax=Caldichromatium japonicum TaxID=2699430 RepID=A0A6G7VC23_9GAMM|nr:class I SAM-dependent methyltransferase [Caldichromatium japonicum]QIK37609.1 methyltransferase domain-containing protein [Caldichromatium japonicum]
MRDRFSSDRLDGLQAWYRSTLGMAVARIECACVQRLLTNVFGYYLVQVGPPNVYGEALAISRIRQRILISPFSLAPSGEGMCILSDLSALPLASDSVDAILLPHVLEHCPQPRAVLAEVERVLIPEGRLVLTGFNPLGLWRLSRLWRPTDGYPPGRFYLAAQVEHWLSEQGFEIESRDYALFGSPLGRHAQSIEDLGRRFWAPLGGLYAIRAVKRVATLTPIKPYRCERHVLLPSGAMRPIVRG